MDHSLETKTLDEIGKIYGTDKASDHHNYLALYEQFFQGIRSTVTKILEIGVLNGASVKTFRDYFPNATVVGADITSTTKRFEAERIKIEILDQSNIQELVDLAIKHGPFDLVIEDGSHMWEHQITSLRTLFPFVKENGIYIIEDLHTNYWDSHRGIATRSCMDYLKEMVDLKVANEQTETVEDAFLRTYSPQVQFITFLRHACIIKKQFSKTNREKSPGKPLVPQKQHDQELPLNIMAHISAVGDILGREGFINLEDDKYSIQGLLIDSPLLEYRVKQHDLTWSEWSPSDKFLGTRGKSQLLTGFAIRLKDGEEKKYTLKYTGKFAGTNKIITVASGQDCSTESNDVLCGIQISLSKKT